MAGRAVPGSSVLAGNGGYIDFLSGPRLRKRGLRAFRQALIPEGEMWLN